MAGPTLYQLTTAAQSVPGFELVTRDGSTIRANTAGGTYVLATRVEGTWRLVTRDGETIEVTTYAAGLPFNLYVAADVAAVLVELAGEDLFVQAKLPA